MSGRVVCVYRSEAVDLEEKRTLKAQVFSRKGRRNQALANLLRCIKSPNFPAAWCRRPRSSAEALQTHTLTCPKKPLTIRAVSSASEGPPVNAENGARGGGTLGVLGEELPRRAMK
jgi:hypothetical protein